MSLSEAKTKLKKEFSNSFHKYYWVPLFDEHGYERHVCNKCGNAFWSVSGSKDEMVCPTPSCSSYSFIGHVNGKPMDYIETWRNIERFFVKHGHVSVPSYPVIARWFPGMYFTLASIVAFQRSVHGRTVFEVPYDRVVIPQVCLRFNDIPNVGVTGRHMTNFIMIGQHTLYDKNNPNTYWKDKCIELDYQLLTGVFGIKPDDIKWVEDVWAGPNAFGYSLEYYAKGLELGNAVFTEFSGTPDNYKPMEQRVIDMGAGLERFCWYTQGTPTAYDAVYGDVIKKMKSLVDYDHELFEKYAVIAGNLNMDEVENIDNERKRIAKMLGTSFEELQKHIQPLEAIYAITDHAKALLYAIADGGLPSNVGGGYNLRIILRRALGFIDKFGLDISLPKVCEWHAHYLKRLSPHLADNLKEVNEILDVEEKRYRQMREKSRKIVLQIIDSKERLDKERMTKLYESDGITPEMISEIADEKGVHIEIPDDFYAKLSEKHMSSSGATGKKIDLNISGLLTTELLFRKNEKELKFTAKVLRIADNWVILDRTAFYAEAGGQDHDIGKINKISVDDVQKFGDIVAHKLSSADKMKTGMVVDCVVDASRRMQLTQHHTAVHIINAACRQVLGNHVWQGGSGKSVDKAHLDITHHSSLSKKEVDEIEAVANKIVQRGMIVKKEILPRQTAEGKYGMRIYQGGAVPDKELRVVSIMDGTKALDAEACGGTHAYNTKDAGEIIITNAERVQDGLVRITIVAGEAGRRYREMEDAIAKECMDILMCKENELVKCTKELFGGWKRARKMAEEMTKEKSARLEKEIKGSINVLDANIDELRTVASKHRGIFFGKKDRSIVVTMDGANEIMKNMPAKLGVKGGGRDDYAQGRYEKEPSDADIKNIKNLIGLR